MKVVIIYFALVTSLAAQRFDCRVLTEFEGAIVEEFGEPVSFFGVRVTDKATGNILMEYKYPEKLVTKSEQKQITKTYKEDLMAFAKECPETPTLEERYRDPFYYKERFNEEFESRPVIAFKEKRKEKGIYTIEYFETVDTLEEVPYITAHMVLKKDSTDLYTRSLPVLLMEDKQALLDTWEDQLNGFLEERYTEDTTRVDFVDQLKKRYILENNRYRTDIALHKKKKEAECTTLKKGATITTEKRAVIDLCKGSASDISITAKRIVQKENSLIAIGDTVSIKALKNVQIKIRS